MRVGIARGRECEECATSAMVVVVQPVIDDDVVQQWSPANSVLCNRGVSIDVSTGTGWLQRGRFVVLPSSEDHAVAGVG